LFKKKKKLITTPIHDVIIDFLPNSTLSIQGLDQDIKKFSILRRLMFYSKQ